MGGVCRVWLEFGGYGRSLSSMGGVCGVWVEFAGYGWSLDDRVSYEKPIQQWAPRGEGDKEADRVLEAQGSGPPVRR